MCVVTHESSSRIDNCWWRHLSFHAARPAHYDASQRLLTLPQPNHRRPNATPRGKVACWLSCIRMQYVPKGGSESYSGGMKYLLWGITPETLKEPCMELLEEHRCFEGRQQRWQRLRNAELRNDLQHLFTSRRR